MKTLDGTFERIEAKLDNLVSKDKNLRNAILLIHSNRHSIHWKYAAGTTGVDSQPIHADNPYHIASIGKTFTATLIAILFERGFLKFDDPVAKYLDDTTLRGLFVYKGSDYSKDVQINHLLNHTSGIADYYEDKPRDGKTIQELLVEQPDRFWKPDETIDFTRDNLSARSAPGKRFHYSDTGYNLLGKVIEKISGKSLHENLHSEIFEPLGMENSYFLFYGEPQTRSPYALAHVYLGRHEVSGYKSLSIDWAGGGIVSTTEDLLRFQQALVGYRLITEKTFGLCTRDLGKFGFGMDYGYGILRLNIHKMALFMPKALDMWGNFGSIGAYMFYNPAYDVYLIGSFNHANYRVAQVRFVIDLMRKVSGVLDS